MLGTESGNGDHRPPCQIRTLKSGVPKQIRSDNGPEFIARAIRQFLEGELRARSKIAPSGCLAAKVPGQPRQDFFESDSPRYAAILEKPSGSRGEVRHCGSGGACSWSR
jgi:hypothetical protein